MRYDYELDSGNMDMRAQVYLCTTLVCMFVFRQILLTNVANLTAHDGDYKVNVIKYPSQFRHAQVRIRQGPPRDNNVGPIKLTLRKAVDAPWSVRFCNKRGEKPFLFFSQPISESTYIIIKNE